LTVFSFRPIGVISKFLFTVRYYTFHIHRSTFLLSSSASILYMFVKKQSRADVFISSFLIILSGENTAKEKRRTVIVVLLREVTRRIDI
jgi:hypothetical protein